MKVIVSALFVASFVFGSISAEGDIAFRIAGRDIAFFHPQRPIFGIHPYLRVKTPDEKKTETRPTDNSIDPEWDTVFRVGEEYRGHNVTVEVLNAGCPWIFECGIGLAHFNVDEINHEGDILNVPVFNHFDVHDGTLLVFPAEDEAQRN